MRVVEGAIGPEFDFASMPMHTVPYTELFTPDGRIPTRITPARRRILEKMRFDREFGDAAKPYWVRRGRGGITAWRADPPQGIEAGYWSRRRMLVGGLAFRGNRPMRAPGVTSSRRKTSSLTGDIRRSSATWCRRVRGGRRLYLAIRG